MKLVSDWTVATFTESRKTTFRPPPPQQLSLFSENKTTAKDALIENITQKIEHHITHTHIQLHMHIIMHMCKSVQSMYAYMCVCVFTC